MPAKTAKTSGRLIPPRRALLGGALALPALLLARSASAQAIRWTRLPGTARDIGANRNMVCVIGVDPQPGGYGIWRWNGSLGGNAWTSMNGSAVSITATAHGNAWVTTRDGSIFRWRNARWELVPGRAKDIASGGGQVFVIGTAPVPGGFSIHRWEEGNIWSRMPGGAVRIAADRDGVPFVVNDQGAIFVWNMDRWDRLPGLARDIGCGRDLVYVIGVNSVPGGHGIYRMTPQTGYQNWHPVNGGGERIAVDADGSPWVVNDLGQIFKG